MNTQAQRRGLTGKVALVTGGSRGIGAAISRRLAADGVSVIVGYGRDAGRARAVADTIAAAGGTALALAADMASPDAIRSLFERAEGAWGGIDIVVANAAIMPPVAPIAEATLADLEAAVAVNLRGVFVTLQEAARRLRDGGRIIVTSSIATAAPAAGMGLYAATKGAVEQLAQVLAKELGPRGITVNAVAPGTTETEMTLPAMREAAPKLNALGRLGQPEDIADVVAFLAGPDSRWITGQVLRVSGGGLA